MWLMKICIAAMVTSRPLGPADDPAQVRHRVRTSAGCHGYPPLQAQALTAARVIWTKATPSAAGYAGAMAAMAGRPNTGVGHGAKSEKPGVLWTPGFGFFFGRGGGIRTRDPLHPMQVRYQAALHPDC